MSKVFKKVNMPNKQHAKATKTKDMTIVLFFYIKK